MSGHWARVNLPDGSVRQDWVPTDQPPSPDGSPGRWHVVEDTPGEPTRWEWHPPKPGAASTAAPTAPLGDSAHSSGKTRDLGATVGLRSSRSHAARPAPTRAPANPTDRGSAAPDDRRAALVVGGIWGAFVAFLPGVRTPLASTWDKVGEEGAAGHALLLAALVALYVVGAAGIAWAFARLITRPPRWSASPPRERRQAPNGA